MLHSSGTQAPTLVAPEDACDCHMHVYDSRFPFDPAANLRPPDASVEDYRLLQTRLRTARTVVVQPSSYGTDNRCTLDALAQLGGAARAVAVVDAKVSDDELRQLDRSGVRGIRFDLVQGGAARLDMLEPLSERVADLGWHVQLHMLPERIAPIENLLLQLPVPIVFDQMGRIPAASGVKHPGFRSMRKLIDRRETWVKLSGAYMSTALGPPTYADVAELAQAFVRAAPERMLWASDWPHPTETDSKPDDAVLFDLLGQWAPDEHTRQRILVDNPAALYGFPV